VSEAIKAGSVKLAGTLNSWRSSHTLASRWLWTLNSWRSSHRLTSRWL